MGAGLSKRFVEVSVGRGGMNLSVHKSCKHKHRQDRLPTEGLRRLQPREAGLQHLAPGRVLQAQAAAGQGRAGRERAAGSREGSDDGTSNRRALTREPNRPGGGRACAFHCHAPRRERSDSREETRADSDHAEVPTAGDGSAPPRRQGPGAPPFADQVPDRLGRSPAESVRPPGDRRASRDARAL